MKDVLDKLNKIAGGIKQLHKIVTDAERETIPFILLRVLENAKNRSPFETGALENATFSRVDARGYKATHYTVGFDGVKIPYLIRQHEDLTLIHNPANHRTPTGNPGRAARGENKFLEKAFHDFEPELKNLDRDIGKLVMEKLEQEIKS